MTALSNTLCALLLAGGFAGSAAAATTSAPTPPASTAGQSATPNAQAPTHIVQRLRADLGKAGFTDITVMPSSFLVRAKDLQGNPVMMVINRTAHRSHGTVRAGASRLRRDEGRNERRQNPAARAASGDAAGEAVTPEGASSAARLSARQAQVYERP